MALSTAATFANLGFDDDVIHSVALLNPSKSTLKNLMVDLSSDCINLTSNAIRNKSLGLMADKGEDRGKAASFVKLLTWY